MRKIPQCFRLHPRTAVFARKAKMPGRCVYLPGCTSWRIRVIPRGCQATHHPSGVVDGLPHLMKVMNVCRQIDGSSRLSMSMRSRAGIGPMRMLLPPFGLIRQFSKTSLRPIALLNEDNEEDQTWQNPIHPPLFRAAPPHFHPALSGFVRNTLAGTACRRRRT